MPPAPAWARLFVGGLSALLVAWGIAGAVASVALAQTPVWTMLGFELVTIAAGVLGVLFGLRKFQNAPALAIACVAGTVFVASFLADRGTAGQVGSLSLSTWTPARLGLSLVLGGIAALVVLNRNPRSWGMAIRAGALGAVPAILVVMLGLTYLGYGRPLGPVVSTPTSGDATVDAITAAQPSSASSAGRSPAWLDRAVRSFNSLPLFVPAKGGGEALRVVGLAVFGIVVIGLISAAVHAGIRAFELGRPESIGPSAGRASA